MFLKHFSGKLWIIIITALVTVILCWLWKMVNTRGGGHSYCSPDKKYELTLFSLGTRWETKNYIMFNGVSEGFDFKKALIVYDTKADSMHFRERDAKLIWDVNSVRASFPDGSYENPKNMVFEYNWDSKKWSLTKLPK